MFIDTHAHLYLDKFDEDIDLVIDRAKNMNIQKIFLPNIDRSTTERMLNLSDKFNSICYPMIGLHPCSVKEDYNLELNHIREMLASYTFYGIGETGIDLYWDKSTLDIQKIAFDEQISIALSNDLPIIIHSRDSLDITIDMISKRQNGNLRGVFHCFNGTVDQAKRIQEIGFYMGLGGVITYKNAGLDKMVEMLSMDHVVLETDAPYLSPVPHRGKRNESSYIPLVASKISEIRNMPLNEIKEITSRNALKLFGLDSES